MVSTKKAIRIAAIGVLLLFALIPSSLVAQSLPRLESLTFSYGYLTPAFDPENYGLYELFINDSDTDVALEVTAIPENPSWVVSVGGIEFSGGGTFLISEFNEGFAISVGNEEIQNYSIQPAPGDVIAPGFGLLDLEIRPESIMMDNPFSPGDDEIHGGFDDPDNPPDQIELIAIFEGDSMTIGGVPGTSGELLRFEFAPYSPWLDLEIKIVAPGGGFTNLYRLRLSRNALSGMVFAESNFNQVGAHGFPPEGTVTVQIWTEPGGTLLAEVSGPADSHTTWMLAEEGIPVDLQPGMEVVASNGEVTARHVILPVTTDEVNLDTDIVKGSGPPGTGIAMHLSLEGNIDRPEGYEPLSFGSPWPHDVEEDEYDPQFIINASGHWQIDLGALGVDLTELAIIDLETSLDRRITRENYDLLDHAAGTTAVFWPGETHEPEILITLNLDVVTLEGATPGLPAEVEVRDAAGDSLFSGTGTTDANGEASWGMAPWPELDVELAPGMEVSVTWGDFTRVLVLPEIEVTGVDTDLDIVRGTAPGDTAHVIVGTLREDSFELLALHQNVVVDSNGVWSTDFSGETDIMIGTLAMVFAEMTNGTVSAARFAVIEPAIETLNAESANVSEESDVTVISTLTDGSSAEVHIPAATLPQGSSVTVAGIADIETLAEQVAPPEGAELVLGFVVEAKDAAGEIVTSGFSNMVTLEFVLNADQVGIGGEGDLVVAFWNGVEWAALEGVERTDNADGSITLIVTTDHFSVHAVLSDPGGLIKSAPADPLSAVNLTAVGDTGIDLTSAPPIEVESGSSGISNLVLFAVIFALAGATIAVVIAIALRRRRVPVAASVR